MTTIIIIVVVALVFFVTICVVTFMVWKREAEMRTDSIKAIENSLGEMLEGLTGDQAASVREQSGKKDTPYDNVLQEMQNMQQEIGDKIKKESDSKAIRQKDRDPFSWVRAEKEEKKHQAVDSSLVATDSVTESHRIVAADTGAIVSDDVIASGNIDGSDAVAAIVSADDDDAVAVDSLAERYEDLTVFRPVEAPPRGLKWVEVFAEKPGKIFKKRRRHDAEALPEEARALDADALPEENSSKLPEEVPLNDAETLLEEAEAFLEKKPQPEQDIGKSHMQHAEDDLQAIEESEELWDLDEDEPDLWDFDEITGQIPEEAQQEAPVGTYGSIELEASFELEAAVIEEGWAEDSDAAEEAEARQREKTTEKLIEGLTGGSIEASAKDIEGGLVAPDTEEAEAAPDIDEFLSALMNMPVDPAGDFSYEAGTGFAEAGGMDELDDAYQFDHPPKPPTGYNIGRSGKEYTVSELEMLIKE